MRLVRLWRFALLGTIAALCAALVASLVLDRGADEAATATVTLGLTDEVSWPFFEPVRGRLASLADDDLRSAIADDLNATDLEIDVVVPETLAVVEVRASAGSLETAIEGADLAAAMILERAAANRLAGIDERIEASEQALEELRGAVDAAEVEIAAVVADLAEARAAEDFERTTLLDSDLFVVTQTRNSRLQSQLEVESDLARLNVERGVRADQVDVVERVSSSPETEDRTLLVVGLGIAVGIIAAAAAYSLATEHGRVIDSEHLTNALGLPVLAWPAPGSDSTLRWLHKVNAAGTELILIEGLEASARESFLEACISDDLSPADQWPLLLDGGAEEQDSIFLEADSALLLTDASSTIRGLRSQIAELASSGIRVAALVEPPAVAELDDESAEEG